MQQNTAEEEKSLRRYFYSVSGLFRLNCHRFKDTSSGSRLFYAHPTALCTDSVFGRGENAFFDEDLDDGVKDRHARETIGEAPFTEQIVGNGFSDQCRKLFCDGFRTLFEISLCQTVADVKNALAVRHGVDEDLRVEDISLTVQITLSDGFCGIFLFVLCKIGNGKSVNGAERKLDLRVVRYVQAAVEMLLHAIDVDVIKMNLGETADILCVDTVPAAAPVFSVGNIAEYAEGTIFRLKAVKILRLQNLLDTVRKAVSDGEDLLPQNEVQIDFVVKIGEGEVLLLVLFDIIRNDIADHG